MPWLAVVLSTYRHHAQESCPWGALKHVSPHRAWWGETVANFRTFVLRQPWAEPLPAVLPATARGETRAGAAGGTGDVCNHRLWDDVTLRLRAEGHDVLAINLEPLFTLHRPLRGTYRSLGSKALLKHMRVSSGIGRSQHGGLGHPGMDTAARQRRTRHAF